MATALVRVRGVGEAIADHPDPFVEPRPDVALAMLAPRREHQQRFGERRHRLVQQDLAQALAQRCPAWLASHPDLVSGALEQRLEPRQVRALACTIDAFDGDEAAATNTIGHSARASIARPSGILPPRDCDRRGSQKTRSSHRRATRNKDTAKPLDAAPRRAMQGSASLWAWGASLRAYTC